MAQGSFKITVSPNGSSIKVDVDGVEGQGCTDLTKVFEALGTKQVQELKPEYYVAIPDAISVNGG
jgi:hypothetical protein